MTVCLPKSLPDQSHTSQITDFQKMQVSDWISLVAAVAVTKIAALTAKQQFCFQFPEFNSQASVTEGPRLTLILGLGKNRFVLVGLYFGLLLTLIPPLTKPKNVLVETVLVIFV